MSAQLEAGFARIANEILEEIPKHKLNGSQFRILMAVWRYTYGFNRKDAEMSLTYFESATGMAKSQIDRELKGLIKANVIVVTKEATFTQSRKIAFNKHFDEWELDSQQKRGQSAKRSTVNQKDDIQSANWSTGTVSQLADQEIHSFKNNIKNSTTADDDFFEPLPLPTESRDGELMRAIKVYNELHDEKLSSRDWPDMTRAVNEFGADHVIATMKSKFAHASSRIRTFKYYLEPLKDRSKGNNRYNTNWKDSLNKFLAEGDE